MSGGSLDASAFFSRAMTAEEIQALMLGLSDPALQGPDLQPTRRPMCLADSVSLEGRRDGNLGDVYFAHRVGRHDATRQI
jgi:hypothetical protein